MHIALDQTWHQRLTVAAAAALTLAVVAGPEIATGIGALPRVTTHDDPRAELTDLGRRALDGLPFAYQLDRDVVVPAETDPTVSWLTPVPRERIEGFAIPLGVRGLAPYGYLGSSDLAPGWAREIDQDDRVLSDVGPLSFACTRWPGEDECSAALLIEHGEEYFYLRSGLGSETFLDEGAPMEVFVFDALDGPHRAQLVLGGLDGTVTERVVLTMETGAEVVAWTSSDVAVADETIWWALVPRPVLTATAYGPDGAVLDEQQVG